MSRSTKIGVVAALTIAYTAAPATFTLAGVALLTALLASTLVVWRQGPKLPRLVMAPRVGTSHDASLAQLGRDLGEPLVLIRDAARALAHHHAGPVSFPQARLVAIIEEATDCIGRHVERVAGPGAIPNRLAVDPARLESLAIGFDVSPVRLVQRNRVGGDVA